MSNSRAVSVDLGTMFFQTAEKTEDDSIDIKNIRNAFVELEKTDDMEEVLSRNEWRYVKDEDRYYVIGEDALRVAKMFPGKIELRRPMASGVLNKNEEKKMLVISELIKNAIGEAPDNKSVACTCVSSESVDGSSDSAFHKARLTGMLKRFGWNVKVIEEGLAVILSERPTVVTAEGDEVPYSGIGLSCLLPHVKIYTKRGLIPIKDVKIGDKVLTHKGRYREVNDVIISNRDKAKCISLQITGYSNSVDDYAFTDNHELYIFRNGDWQWVGCNDIEEGDIVGEPIPVEEKVEFRPAMTICDRVTCSNEYTKRRIEVSANVQRLIGYFLTDGSILRKNNEGIKFDFGLDEIKYALDVKDILFNNFGLESQIKTEEEDGTISVLCYSRGIGNYFRNNFYNENQEKIYPWELTRLTSGDCLSLLAGFIRGDGWNSPQRKSIGFTNTSHQLVMVVRHLFAKLGVPTSISKRDPRDGGVVNGKRIHGKKEVWECHSGSIFAFKSLSDLIENLNVDNSKTMSRLFINSGFVCGKIQKKEVSEYSGKVYDLKVEEDHSFSGPMLTIHNCGAGRVNCVLAYRGMSIVGMSTARSGDWIDDKVSEQLGLPVSQVTSIKEKKLDFNNLDYDDDVIFALDVYYSSMIEYVFKNFAKKFQEVKSELDAPLDIVVAGGTSMPKGFCKKLEKVIEGLKLPFEVKEVRHSDDPRNSVVKGCLTQAIIAQRKIAKSEDEDDFSDILGD